MKKYRICMIAGFCLVLLFCTCASMSAPNGGFSDTENRELAKKPVFLAKSFLKGKYQRKYEKWLNDGFFSRDAWTAAAAGMQALEGKTDVNGVYLGKGGYLLEKYDERDYDAEQVEENIKNLSTFLNYCVKRYGKDHVRCVMVPSKTEALADKLPAFARAFDASDAVLELKKSLDEKDILLEARDALSGHEDEYIYYRTDHHWTTLGAYYAWEDLAKSLGLPERDKGHYRRETAFNDFYGTTYNKAHVAVPRDRVEIFHNPAEGGVSVMIDGEKPSPSLYFYDEAKSGFNRYNVFLSKNTFKITIASKSGSGKSLLLVKDSFANCFVPFLTEDYGRIIMIDCRYGKTPIKDVIEEIGEITDVLVMFNNAKFMENLKLGMLADVGGKETGMKKFDPDEFLK